LNKVQWLMKFLKTPKDAEAEIKRLIRGCKRLRWAVAWASASPDFSLFQLLKEHEQKIRQMAVGIHFYQTHPNFIAAFLDRDTVHFVMDLSGIFHPKLYLFEHGDGTWDCITGSPNFTKAAFESNAEVAVHFDNHDMGAGTAYSELDSTLNDFFSRGKSVNAEWLSAYRSIWQRQQRRLGLLSGTYEPPDTKSKPKKSPLDVPLFLAGWPEYLNSVKDDTKHSTEGRLAILEEARRLFTTHAHFCDLDDNDRRGIAGIFETKELPWLWFGTMKGHFFFPKAINDNVRAISDALDEIPIAGEVTQTHYDRYVALIRRAYARPGIGTATRLLAFKRPDYFVCFDAKNRDKLCEEFQISKSVDLDDYWEKIVQRITDSNWWNAQEPTNSLEKRIWNCRSAFLDVKFYEPD
jgi:HKD family nuclease